MCDLQLVKTTQLIWIAYPFTIQIVKDQNSILPEKCTLKWRPKFRFSMRTLFIIVTLLCVLLVPLSVMIYQARQQRLAVEWVLASGGTTQLNESGELYYVGFTDAQVTDAGLEHLKGLTSLNKLRLKGAQVTDAGLKHLKGMTSLWYLDLRNTQITDAGLEHLNGLTSLNTLWLADTKITDAELDHLKGQSSLKVLGLEDTQITDAGLEHLKGLTNLNVLSLQGTQVTDAGLSEIKAALPNCIVRK